MRKRPSGMGQQGGGGGRDNRQRSRNHNPKYSKPSYGDYNNDGGQQRGGGGGKNAHAAREKYLNMAREALSGGDRVLSEYYLQHADHYFRVLRENQQIEPRPQQQQPPQENGAVQGNGAEPGNSAPDGNRQHTAPAPQPQQQQQAQPRPVQSQPREPREDRAAPAPGGMPAFLREPIPLTETPPAATEE